MFGRKNTACVKIIKHLDTSSHYWCSEAVLISVTDGKGALAVHSKYIPDSYYGSLSLAALMLNNVPLMQARLPGCPTCEGMLATGYGIESSNCAELKAIGEKLNSSYRDIENSVEALSPLLLLLKSGLYVIADSIMYPTDGNGHFFWDVPNELTTSPATAAVFTENYDYVDGFPSYIFPSQSNASFDETRVKFYMQEFSQTENWPRAISYHIGEFVSILLDGHHKVAAAALLGKETRCIEIIPLSAMSYKQGPQGIKVVDDLYFSTIKIPAKDIPSSTLKFSQETFGKRTDDNRLVYKPTNLISLQWDTKYSLTVKNYPELSELAERVVLGITNITDELINECLSNQMDRNLRILRFIISSLARKKDIRFKKLALACGKSAEPKLKEASFKALSQIENDKEVEDFFIEYLVNHNDKYDKLKKIADNYWKNNSSYG